METIFHIQIPCLRIKIVTSARVIILMIHESTMAIFNSGLGKEWLWKKKMDLISCRNVLIYMGMKLQRKILPILHYSLNEGGYLFLGSSESIGRFDDLFSTIETHCKIYQ